jgi:hypothetical protein
MDFTTVCINFHASNGLLEVATNRAYSHDQHWDFPHPLHPQNISIFSSFLLIDLPFPSAPSYLGELGEEEIVRAQVIEG